MDQRPIGVFDTGLGGLTAVRELTALLPNEQVIYFGDTGRVPYGTRSRDTIIKYARQDVAFLRSFDLKAIVIACGTVSTTALDVLQGENDLPILGVVEPAARRVAEVSRTGRVGLIGTAATIRTGAYERSITTLRPEAEIHAAACPLFVPLVENGRIHPGDVVIETVVAEYLAPIRAAGVDTLVLGCTHYPLLRQVIANFMGPEVALVDTGAEVARDLARRMELTDELTGPGQTGSCRYFVSDDAPGFSQMAAAFLRRDVDGLVTQIQLEQT